MSTKRHAQAQRKQGSEQQQQQQRLRVHNERTQRDRCCTVSACIQSRLESTPHPSGANPDRRSPPSIRGVHSTSWGRRYTLRGRRHCSLLGHSLHGRSNLGGPTSTTSRAGRAPPWAPRCHQKGREQNRGRGRRGRRSEFQSVPARARGRHIRGGSTPLSAATSQQGTTSR